MTDGMIVRADDLGFCEGINYAIEKSVKQGIIRNVGLMVNMPATEHGYHLIQNEDICLGQHTCISNGRPVLPPEQVPSLVQADSSFKPSSAYRKAEKDIVVLDEAVAEAEAQYQRFVELTGRKPGYFEAHAVMSDNFFKALQIVAQRHDLRYLGLALDKPVDYCGHSIYMHAEAMRPAYDPFATLKRIWENRHADGYELMICHPGYVDAYLLRTSSMTLPRTQDAELCTAEATKQWLCANNIKLYRLDELG